MKLLSHQELSVKEAIERFERMAGEVFAPLEHGKKPQIQTTIMGGGVKSADPQAARSKLRPPLAIVYG